MEIALATCANLPDWEVDDRPFHAALAARGARLAHPAWDDPGVDWGAFDACLIRTTWDYMERRDAYLAWAEGVAARTRLFNPLPVVRWNTHKSYLKDLAVRGVPIAPTVWLEPGSRVSVAETLDGRGWRKAFLKPMIGAIARETLPFAVDRAGLEAAQVHLDRLLPREGMMLQPYYPGVETEGELSAVFIDGRLSHGVRKVPVPGDYRVQDDFGAHDEPATLTGSDLALATGILDLIQGGDLWPPGTLGGPLLYGRADLLRDEAGDLRLSELELVEPSLFFRHGPGAAERLAEALLRRLTSPSLP